MSAEGIKLSVSETKLLAAVFSAMDGIPTLNYPEVAIVADIKYARNARASLKRVFKKIQVAAGHTIDASSGEESDGDKAASTAKKPAAAKTSTPTKKGIARKINTPVKGNRVTKNVSAPRAKPVRKAKKEAKEEIVDEDSDDIEMDDNGKFVNTFTPINRKKKSREQSLSAPKASHQASISGNEVDTTDKNEEADAAFRGMTVEEWRAWKIENDFDAYDSHCPTPVCPCCLSEEAA